MVCSDEITDTANDVINANTGVFVEPQNPEACLDGLPDESLLMIFKNLNVVELARMCLTNQHYRNVANGILYENLSCMVDRWKMQAVDNNPQLGQHVKTYRNTTMTDPEEHMVRTLDHAVNLQDIFISPRWITDP
jgi:hypothetical protein